MAARCPPGPEPITIKSYGCIRIFLRYVVGLEALWFSSKLPGSIDDRGRSCSRSAWRFNHAVSEKRMRFPRVSPRNEVRVISCGVFEGGSVKRKLIIAIVALLALGTAAETPAQSSEAPADKKIDAIFSGVTSPDAPGLAVLVRKNGSTVFERGYGVRELRTKRKIDAHANFRLASFTKQFTAMAIMLLVHDGKLRYDETLAEVFPDFPAYGKTITVRNLLNHTSGLPDYEDLMTATETPRNSWIWTPTRQIQDAEVFELLKKENHGKFAPGTSWSYSNSGYVLLGVIVSKVSGQSYGEFLRERIFAPL